LAFSRWHDPRIADDAAFVEAIADREVRLRMLEAITRGDRP
jgi:hypothetical protein